jgi:hypothetical protein
MKPSHSLPEKIRAVAVCPLENATVAQQIEFRDSESGSVGEFRIGKYGRESLRHDLPVLRQIWGVGGMWASTVRSRPMTVRIRSSSLPRARASILTLAGQAWRIQQLTSARRGPPLPVAAGLPLGGAGRFRFVWTSIAAVVHSAQTSNCSDGSIALLTLLKAGQLLPCGLPVSLATAEMTP